MTDFRWREYRSDDNENEAIRAVLVEDALVEFEGGEQERVDTWFWFYGATDYDRWFSFALSDYMPDEEETNEMIENIDLAVCRKFALYVGSDWDGIMNTCPHCVALRNRKEKAAITPETFEALLMTSDEDIHTLAAETQFEAMASVVERTGGIKLSLN